MAQLLNKVQPGQIITSDLWNLAVDAINELLQAGQTAGIQIRATAPDGTTADPIRVATVLQITGQSFGYSVGQARVSFEADFGTFTVSQDQFMTGSSDSRLVFVVPAMGGLPPAGATLTLRVSNGVSSDIKSVVVMPLIIALQGDVFVNWRSDIPNPSPNPLVPSTAGAPGPPADFAYQIQTGINMPATFDLSVDIPEASVAIPPELVGSIQILDPGNQNQPVANNRLQLGKNDGRNILVRIPSLPAPFANATFSIRVRATSATVVGEDKRSFTVGATVTPPDPNIELQPTGALVINPTTGATDNTGTNGRLDGTTISLRPTWQMHVLFNVTFKQAGSYDVSVAPKAGTTLHGWDPQLFSTLANYPSINANESRPMQFTVTAATGADATGSVVFRVKRTDSTQDQTREYSLRLLS
jgi:hypothetical protein